MKYIRSTIFLTNLLGLLLFSCRPSTTIEPIKNETHDAHKEQMITLNKFLVKHDMMLIEEYARRNQLNLSKTESGLCYQIVQKSSDIKISPTSRVVFSYQLLLLDGTVCYSSDSLGLKEAVLGKGELIKGLEEGLLYLHLHDSAIFIIPPHLAFGMIGDTKCIPPRSSVIYKVRILKIFSK